MGDCLKCKDYRECSQDHGWFHYGQIKWCPYQILWILEHAETLRSGKWPQDFKAPGNVDSLIQGRNLKAEATFVKPVTVLAEVEYRLEQTGIAGKFLLAQIKAGETLETFEPEARAALMYIKGWRRKRIDFKRWLREVFYKSKTGKKYQLQTISCGT